MNQLRMPSPAILVAALALVAAIAGTALAAPGATMSKLTKKKVVKIADQEINKLAPGLSVAHANTANTADTATNAENASTANSADTANTANSANGVKPVEVDFTAPAGTAVTTLLDQGGARFQGECTAGGTARLEIVSTANNGSIRLAQEISSGISDPDFDVGSTLLTSTGLGPSFIATVVYRGASGTTVSGDLLLMEGAAAAQCVIAGTLFVR